MRSTVYAVRGELMQRGEELRKAGREIIFTNIGNPQALGQKPLSFNRQVQALVNAPFLLENERIIAEFPEDAIARAREMLTKLPGGVGAYQDSRGSPAIRQEIADFLQHRDGYPSNAEHIFMTDGASPAVRMCLQALIRDSRDAILVPIPQYPLYSASIQLLGGSLLPYHLKEESGWSMNVEDLRNQVRLGRDNGMAVRALVFINPGNPTGQCLSYQNLKDLIEFAAEEKLVLMADEVYQTNIYQDELPFVSAKRVLRDIGGSVADELELISFHTISKGVIGECGLRGGYMELVNIHPEVIGEMYKIASINLSPNTMGQVSISLMVNEPKPGDTSYEKHVEEKGTTLASLIRRAHIMTDGFNKLEGVTCNFTEGAMYSFPRIRLPPKAIQAAKEAGKPADTFYCLALLEATGISTVPGSGFGQEEGTLHLRTTILPPENSIKEVIARLTKFHEEFMDKYR
ncbi:hypothetical protein WJX84_007601 [Apatococcus fuscideae]|uniref:Aminotransferase class I/classII large domain-containing protein n=1 Tax=Apatococcus fuscideae TaxID=2026836 RepID=A0AAW1TH17_9CHLO